MRHWFHITVLCRPFVYFLRIFIKFNGTTLYGRVTINVCLYGFEQYRLQLNQEPDRRVTSCLPSISVKELIFDVCCNWLWHVFGEGSAFRSPGRHHSSAACEHTLIGQGLMTFVLPHAYAFIGAALFVRACLSRLACFIGPD